jgi:hypothetical protein
MFRDWQENTHSIFCDGSQDPIQRMDVWFCVTQEPRREAQPRADEHAETQTRALLSATDILAPLDKDLSWMSAFRCTHGKTADLEESR